MAIIQARMSSQRLRGKMLLKLYGESLISRVIRQVSYSKQINEIIIATSINKSDDPIANFCKKNKIKYFRGNLKNVASRFFKIIKKYKPKAFVRISGDSPLIDPLLIDKLVKKFKKKKYDIVTNICPRSFPKGQSVEVIKSSIYSKFYKKFKKSHTEHVTNFFYENKKEFNIFSEIAKKNLSKIRLCIDTQKDFKKIKNFLEINKNTLFTWQEIVN